MNPKVLRPRFQRARSESEKLDRRQAILAAAEEHLAEASFEGFSMAGLARKAGIAKGTLYLYFETREEVLLSLHTEHLAAFATGLTGKVAPGMTDPGFVAVFYNLASADPVFLDLSAHLGAVIEHNISTEALVASKRAMRDVLFPVATHLEACLDLAPGRALVLLTWLTALLVGAWQVDAGPSLQGEDIPADVTAMAATFECSTVFLSAAPLLVAGAR